MVLCPTEQGTTVSFVGQNWGKGKAKTEPIGSSLLHLLITVVNLSGQPGPYVLVVSEVVDEEWRRSLGVDRNQVMLRKHG